MKFRDGMTVEVCRRDESVCGSWFRAKIISSDKCHHKVQYDQFLNVDRQPVTEKVHCEAIRPVPPPVVAKSWESGDTVEVHDCNSWKMGKVMKVLPCNFFIVRLLDTDQQRTCHQSNLRFRQSWQSDKWVLTEQAVRNQSAADGKALVGTMQGMPSLAMSPQESQAEAQFKEVYAGIDANNREAVQIKTSFCRHKHSKASLQLESGKRKADIPWVHDSDGTHLWRDSDRPKKRKFQNVCRSRMTVAESILPVLEKVDNIPFPIKQMGEEFVCQPSLKDRICGSLEVKQEKTKLNVHVPQIAKRVLKATQAESSQCSVSSSSSHMSNDIFHLDKKFYGPDDDALSSCECANRKGDIFASKEEVSAGVHKLELYAYCSALRAFHASGPLSWEQEALLTSLRLSLHVSNDEHLHELRFLHSA